MSAGINILKTISTGFQGTIQLCCYEGERFVIKDCILSRYSNNETTVLTRCKGSPYTAQLYDIELPSQYREKAVPMRFYENGDLFNLMVSLHDQNKNCERLAKLIFKQIVLAILELHSNQIAHRDLKLENYFIDSEFNIVLGDFGLSSDSVTENEATHVAYGSLVYMAPEVIECSRGGLPYNSYHADMWSCGCLLFLIITGNMPFGDKGACGGDYNFLLVRDGKWEEFWNIHESGGCEAVSAEVKSIIQSLFRIDPRSRPTAAELINHAWFAPSIATNNDDDNSSSASSAGASADEASFLDILRGVSLSMDENGF